MLESVLPGWFRGGSCNLCRSAALPQWSYDPTPPPGLSPGRTARIRKGPPTGVEVACWPDQEVDRAVPVEAGVDHDPRELLMTQAGPARSRSP